MSWALVIGAGVAVVQSENQSGAAETAALAQRRGGGDILQGDFTVNVGGSGVAYQSAAAGSGGNGMDVDPMLLVAGALGVAGILLLKK